LGYYKQNIVDDTTLEFGRAGFWVLHAVGTAALFLMGMRFAVKKAPAPVLAYHLLRRAMRKMR
jgi:hypothetical protein